MRNRVWWLLLACVLARAAWADDATGSAGQQLTRIESETALLKARERRLEVEAQIAGREAEIASKRADARKAIAPWGLGDPVLRSVEGIGSRLLATLELPDHDLVEVKQGDTLADGSRVVSVRPDHVELAGAERRRVRLGITLSEPQRRGSDPIVATLPPLGPLAENSGALLPALPPLPSSKTGAGLNQPLGVRR